MIAFAFILWHITQLHWMGAPLGGGQFDPHHAASSAAVALKPVAITLLYATGIIATVYHLRMGYGAWVSRGVFGQVRRRCRGPIGSVCSSIGLAAAGLGALGGMRSIDVERRER